MTITRAERPVTAEEAHGAVLRHALPWLRRQPGYRGLAVLLRPSSGESIAFTLWETEGELRATRETADELRKNMIRMFGGARDEVEEYEVVVLETAGPSIEGR